MSFAEPKEWNEYISLSNTHIPRINLQITSATFHDIKSTFLSNFCSFTLTSKSHFDNWQLVMGMFQLRSEIDQVLTWHLLFMDLGYYFFLIILFHNLPDWLFCLLYVVLSTKKTIHSNNIKMIYLSNTSFANNSLNNWFLLHKFIVLCYSLFYNMKKHKFYIDVVMEMIK